MRCAQAGLQPGDELARLLFTAKTYAMLVQANLPATFAAVTLWLDDNLHADHLLEARRFVDAC
jgi:hypothetical protein